MITKKLDLSMEEEEIVLKELARDLDMPNLSESYRELCQRSIQDIKNLNLSQEELIMLRHTFGVREKNYADQYTKDYQEKLRTIFNKIDRVYIN